MARKPIDKFRRSKVIDYSSRSGAVDWASLPQDLLRIIAMKLPAISNYVGFRSICTSWRSAASRTDLPPQLPWLILSSRGDEGSTLSFLDPSQSRVYNFHLPETRGKVVYGTPHGWLLMMDEAYIGTDISLFNPITRSHIPLPPLHKRECSMSQAILCFNPSSISQQHRYQQLMIGIFSGHKLLFLRHGDDNWGEIDTPYHSTIDSMAYFEGSIHIANRYRKLSVLDVASSSLVPLTEETQFPDFDFAHLMEMEGSLFFIGWKRGLWIAFFRLNKSTRRVEWKMVNDAINDMAILTSPLQSISICTRDFLNGEENQIYFFGDEYFRTTLKWETVLADIRSTIIQLPTRSNFFDWDRTALTWIVPTLY